MTEDNPVPVQVTESGETVTPPINESKDISDPEPGESPFNSRQLIRIDEALTAADRESGLTFSVYVGALAENTREDAFRLHDELPDPAKSVLIAISPDQQKVEIVTGSGAALRIPDRICALAALSMTAAFAGGDLTAGIVTGLRMLADHTKGS
ncbi:DUF5130 family protein [Fodinicola acaciae]|uniref:DUF5130 family protein n=1 Tax=Fodinicola acaciae TaxID=2681555 RepID=UPI001C9E2623|nr:DUF5130 family protein [Fodinicola acaciae]